MIAPGDGGAEGFDDEGRGGFPCEDVGAGLAELREESSEIESAFGEIGFADGLGFEGGAVGGVKLKEGLSGGIDEVGGGGGVEEAGNVGGLWAELGEEGFGGGEGGLAVGPDEADVEWLIGLDVGLDGGDGKDEGEHGGGDWMHGGLL